MNVEEDSKAGHETGDRTLCVARVSDFRNPWPAAETATFI